MYCTVIKRSRIGALRHRLEEIVAGKNTLDFYRFNYGDNGKSALAYQAEYDSHKAYSRAQARRLLASIEAGSLKPFGKYLLFTDMPTWKNLSHAEAFVFYHDSKEGQLLSRATAMEKRMKLEYETSKS
jgi:hypothetical protein